MYKILHLFPFEKFTENYINFISANFHGKYHEFWVYGSKTIGIKKEFLLYENVKYVPQIENKLKTQEIYSFDKIICHSVFSMEIINYFFYHRRLLKRLYLYFWGGDKFYSADFWNELKRNYVIRNACGIINIIPEEKKYMKKRYKYKGKYFVAKYYSADIELLVRKKRDKGNLEKGTCNIQIGNSATPSNNHIYILRKLEKYKDENIKIYVPLSYGDKKYANKVCKIGKSIFGAKFVPIMEFYEESEYYEVLYQMDIAIFGMKRQQALGNVEALLAFGKKVFLMDKSILKHYYGHTCRCEVSAIQDIENMDFYQFVSFTEEQKNNNIQRMKEILEIEPRIEAWNKIFNDK